MLWFCVNGQSQEHSSLKSSSRFVPKVSITLHFIIRPVSVEMLNVYHTENWDLNKNVTRSAVLDHKCRDANTHLQNVCQDVIFFQARLKGFTMSFSNEIVNEISRNVHFHHYSIIPPDPLCTSSTFHFIWMDFSQFIPHCLICYFPLR